MSRVHVICKQVRSGPELTHNGIPSVPYKFKDDALDNGESNPDNKCFCYNGRCLPRGLIDVTHCYYGEFMAKNDIDIVLRTTFFKYNNVEQTLRKIVKMDISRKDS